MAYAAQRLVHRFEFAEIGQRRKRRDFLRRIQRIKPRTFAGLEAHRTSERVGNDENVGEDDRGIEIEPADRLQRNLGGIFRREAEVEETSGLGAQLAIFGQITAGLPHHPDRRYLLPVAGKHVDEGFGSGILAQ